MRILKKAVILPITCDNCGCVYKPGKGDMRTGIGVVKEYAPCPTCCKYNTLIFKKENNNAES